MAEQVRCSVTARSRPGARPRRAPAGRDLLPGKRPACRVCYTPPASAATARGDGAAGRRGGIAGMTTLMLPADLAAVSSLPLAGQRAAPAGSALRGRWRVRRSRAARNSRFWCLSFAGLLLHRSRCLRCPGRLADSCPRQGATRNGPDPPVAGECGRIPVVQRTAGPCERSCRWPCRAVEAEPAGRWQQGPGQRASPAGGTGPGQSPASAAAGQRARWERGQPGRRAL